MNIINLNKPINYYFEKNNNNNDLGALDLQKNFLSLFIAQIKNQDPTDPIKNTELTSQLAQINIVSGIERLNNTVKYFSNQMNKNQNVQLSSLIGHRVMIPNTQIVHTKDIKTRCGIELIGYATSVEVKITDNNGKVLYVKNLENKQPGIYNFFWNGEDLDKKSVETGKYNISVTAKNGEKNVPVECLSEALVNSIITTSGDPMIDLGVEGNITLAKIREIFK